MLTTRTTRPTHPLLLAAPLTLLLAACGGGGGGGAPANVAPVALADALPASGIAALPVAFDGSGSSDSDGSVVAWQWDFGDGANGTGSSTNHTYAAAGSYTATLTVTDDDGLTGADTVTITVAANAPPTAAFTTTPSSGTAPLTVAFDGSGSGDSDGSVVAWQWDFGDGGNGTGSSINHVYAAAGSYTATLTVTDDKGGSHAATRSITVAANAPPAAVINANTLEGFAPLTVAFNGNVSSDSDGSITTYRWNFGKAGGSGNVAAIAAPTTQYNNPGIYTAQLTVTDDKGASAVATTTVYVAAATDTYALAGAFTVPDTAFADCDTASGGTLGCNLGIANAQAIQSPSTVGGHVDIADDIIDDYKLSFAGGETITLTIADASPANNLDLRLYEGNGTVLLLQSANPNATIETITVPAAGDYMVRAYSVSGHSNYILSIGTATAAVAGDGDEYVDGEFIAHFSQLRMPWRIDAQREARAAELGMDVAGGDADTPMLLRDRGSLRAIRRGIAAHTRATLQRLARHPDVAWVELNRVRQPLALNATDTYFPAQWNLPLAHFPGAWDVDALRGAGTVVAVIDTGILAAHPDLSGRLVAGYDFVSEFDNAHDGNGIDSSPADPGGDGVGRSIFHGTHVAGIVAANAQFSATGGNTGISGGAPSAQVMPLRAVGRYGGLSYDIVQAIRYAAGLPNDSGTTPAQRADVINLSLGSTGYSQLEQDAVTAARAAGVIVVAAGGNSGIAAPMYPAGYAGVVGVGAVTLDRRRASYSNTGAHIDVAAPGGDNQADLDGNGFPDGILGTLANDGSGSLVFGYDFYQGTSMAAPHVAAVAALMKAVSPSLTPAVFDSMLASGALTRDLGAGGRDDEFGMGLIDAELALVATGAVSATPALAIASPTRIGLGATTTQSLVVVDNGGGGSLSVSNATDNQPWLSVTAQSVDSSGLGSYLVSIDRTSLAAGSYSGTVTFTTSAGALNVPVNMIVDAAVETAGVGTIYTFVWDPVAQAAVAQQSLNGTGSASFNFGPVLAGNYQVFAGTDNDNDGFICDPGEACGAWLSLQEQKLFPHVRDRTDLSFNVGYTNTLGTLSTGSAPRTIPARGFPRR